MMLAYAAAFLPGESKHSIMQHLKHRMHPSESFLFFYILSALLFSTTSMNDDIDLDLIV
jgi:hypothetical protein